MDEQTYENASQYTEETAHSAFEELDVANHITLVRIYDVMIALLRNVNPTEADALVRLHEQGEFLSPPLAINTSQE